MRSNYLIVILLVFNMPALADASIDTEQTESGFLLSAPGTLSGHKSDAEKKSNPVMETDNQHVPANQLQEPYRFVGEDHRFRQYGQQPVKNNPWSDAPRSSYPPQQRFQDQQVENPWQPGGMPSVRELGAWNRQIYPPVRAPMYGPMKNFDGMNPYSDFPPGIYRDTNPALFSSPYNYSLMPGLGVGGDDLFMPFVPFDMY